MREVMKSTEFDEILRPVVADHAVRALGRIAAERQGRVEQQVQPVQRLFDPGAALRPDRAGVLAARERGLHCVGDPRETRPRRMLAEVWRTVGEEIAAERFGRDVACADVRAVRGRQTLGVSGRGQHAIEVDLGVGRHQIADAVLADAEPVDLLDWPRAVGKERLPRLMRRRDRLRTVRLPGATVGLARHVGQRIKPVLRAQLDLVHRLVGRALPLLAEVSRRVEIAVRRTVKLGGVMLERMRAELLDVDHRGPRQPLRAQHVEARRRAVGVGQRREPVLRARLVARHQRRDGVDGGVRACEIGDARLLAHGTLRGHPPPRPGAPSDCQYSRMPIMPANRTSRNGCSPSS